MISNLGGSRDASKANSVDNFSEIECTKPHYSPTIEEFIQSDDIVSSVGKLKKDYFMCILRECVSWLRLGKDIFDLFSTTFDEIRDSVKTVNQVKSDWPVL